MLNKAKSSNSKKNSKSGNRQPNRKQTTIPSAYAVTRVTTKPSVRSINNGTTVVAHTEYVADVYSDIGSGDIFHAESYSINPGLAKTFPWLSSVAGAFESYRFRKLEFRYEPLVPTTTQGVVQIAVDFDAADPLPTTKMDLMSNHRAVRSAVFSSAVYSADMKDSGTLGERKYVRIGAVPSTRDPKTYDLGNLIVATSDLISTDNDKSVGEVYVSYVVELYTPQLDASARAAASSLKLVTLAGADLAHPLGTQRSYAGSLPHSTNSTELYIDTTGEFLVEWYSEADDAETKTVTVASSGDSEVTLLRTAAQTGLVRLASYRVRILKPGGAISFATTENLTYSEVRVSLYEYDIA